jgi:hypothetical protein
VGRPEKAQFVGRDATSDARKAQGYITAALFGVLTAVVLYYGAQALNLKLIP